MTSKKDSHEKEKYLYNQPPIQIQTSDSSSRPNPTRKKPSSFSERMFRLKMIPWGSPSKLTNSSTTVVSITYEEIGLFPRSFSRVFDRFVKQVFSDVENLVIQEYRFYRYLFLTTLQSLFILLFIPFLVNLIAKQFLVQPLIEYFWNTKQSEIFINSYQQKRAFSELQDFEEKLYFESLRNELSVQTLFSTEKHESVSSSLKGAEKSNQLSDSIYQDLSIQQENNLRLLNEETNSFRKFKPTKASISLYKTNDEPTKLKTFLNNVSILKRSPSADENLIESLTPLPPDGLNEFSVTKQNLQTNMALEDGVWLTSWTKKRIEQRLQQKTVELAIRYNAQSIEAMTNCFADLLALLSLFLLFFILEIQINITKSFLLEVFFGLDDSKKSLLILLITDLLVGYHSSNLWEFFFQFLLNHYGLPENQTGIFLLVATFPVLLDVLFKYLIFRHLNRASPATVATYHAMIE